MRKLLIADCNEDYRTALDNALKDQYHVLCCRTGTEAWELLHREHPDIFVLDLMLPELDGLTLLERCCADGIRPIPQTDGEGRALGYRLPVFDIHIKARHRDSYSAATQNALATELFRLGFFDPARRREALAALSVMDFEGKELIAARLGAEDGGEVRP